MLLRDHPLLRYKGIPSWPPVWTWTDGREDKRPRGEIGILKAVFLSYLQHADRCFLYIDHEESMYLGCLLMDDTVFCQQIVELLQSCLNRPIAEIGGLDISHTLYPRQEVGCMSGKTDVKLYALRNVFLTAGFFSLYSAVDIRKNGVVAQSGFVHMLPAPPQAS